MNTAVIDCCARIQIPGAGLRLEERSIEHDCDTLKLTLYECPSCGALWAACDAFWDHGTWYRKEYVRVSGQQSFDALVVSTRSAKPDEASVHRATRPLDADDIARAMQIASTVIPSGRIR